MNNQNTNQQTADQVQTYFHKEAGDFDSIYSGKTSPLMRLLNRWLRHDIYLRYEMTIAECANDKGKRILDIGCGSGRYCHELAARGAGKCIGIDFAQNMLDLANDFAKRRGVSDRCEFLLGQYLDVKLDQPCDVAVAMGYFDYIPNCVDHLKKMRADAREKLITIFPVAGTFRAFVRKIRLGARGCPVFFFTPEQIDDLLKQSGWRKTRIERVGQLWFVVAVPA